MINPSTRRVAQKIRQAGRSLSHETVRRWRANGWRPLAREEHPLDAAQAALDDAIPVLTRDPLTIAESFVGASKRAEALDHLSDAELLRKASRALAIAVIVVADAVTRDTALTRPIEVGTLLRSLAKCFQAASAGFVQARTLQAAEPRAPTVTRNTERCRSQPPGYSITSSAARTGCQAP